MTAAAARRRQCAIIVGFARVAVVDDVAAVAAAIRGLLWWRLGRCLLLCGQCGQFAAAAADVGRWRHRCGIQLGFNIGRKLSFHCAGECIEPA